MNEKSKENENTQNSSAEKEKFANEKSSTAQSMFVMDLMHLFTSTPSPLELDCSNVVLCVGSWWRLQPQGVGLFLHS